MDVEIEQNTYLPHVNEDVITGLFGDTKISFIILLIFIVVVYIAIFFLVGETSIVGSSLGTTSSNMIVVCLEIMLWVVLIYIIYINLKKYDTRNFDFQMKMEDLFNSKVSELSVNAKNTDTDTETNCETELDKESKEVFHIADNNFTYEEARDVCDMYDARLATYDEIETAYNKGANWCSYGWSRDKLALFPTQKALFNELKTIPGHENDCGRPGINGGYFGNKHLKFGANCYGVKPKPSQKDKDYTHATNHIPTVKDGEDKPSLLDNYIIAPFNKDTWTIKE